ncbi:hypothetical protein EDD11_007713 [Mortierella claussenii]|nr:hypothetical protein EDD11_007713 [Mortierella claussenii]
MSGIGNGTGKAWKHPLKFKNGSDAGATEEELSLTSDLMLNILLSAAELAQKYKDKALARKRGAGTHQPKFRGFSLGKSADSGESTATDKGSSVMAAEVSTETTATTSTTIQKFASTAERPRPDFRGFSLKPTRISEGGMVSAATPDRTRNGSQEPSATLPTTTKPRTDKLGRQKSTSDSRDARPSTKGELSQALKALSIERTSSNEDASVSSIKSRRPRPVLDLLGSSQTQTPPHPSAASITSKLSTSSHREAETSSTVSRSTFAQNPGGKQTRSVSRISGNSPNFKISWGKNRTVVTSDSQQHPAMNAVRAVEAVAEQRPVIEDTVDGMGLMDDFRDYDSIPSPSGDHVDQGLSSPQQDSTRESSKRKPTAPELPDSTTTTSRKNGARPGKRRRFIVEEPDENEDPQPIHRNVATGVTKKTDDEKQISAVVPEKQARKDVDKNKDTVLSKPKPNRSKHARQETATITAPATTTLISKIMPPGMRPMRQTTLMQLSTKPAKVADASTAAATTAAYPSRQQPQPADDTDDDESDFEQTLTKSMRSVKLSSKGDSRPIGEKNASTSSTTKKGASDQTVKNYKQLQIHCLKFWGPFSSVSRPATVSNRATAKKLPVDGEIAEKDKGAAPARRTVQSVLEIDEAPLSEMDVIADAVRDVADKFIDTIEDPAMQKEMLTVRSELETLLIEQVDMLDDHTLLRASVRKAAALKKELRVRLLEAQRRRQKTRTELKRVRSTFEREERTRRRLEETHKFLTDLEALRDQVVGSDGEEDEGDSDQDERSPKTGLQSLIATVGSRCGGGAAVATSKNTRPGMLGTLKEFNQLLETMERNLQSMPLVTPSQEVSTSRYSDEDDDDYPDFEALLNL